MRPKFADTKKLTMKYFSFLLLSLAFGLCFLQGCIPDSAAPVLKVAETDPFQNHLPESQFFALDADQDTVIEGSEGTTIVLPKGCLLDAAGNTYTGPFDLELAEATQFENQLLGNLASGNKGKPTNSKGSMFWNATTAEGEQLQVNPENPIYIEIPFDAPTIGLKARHGTRSEDGEMTWDPPQAQEKFLTPVDIFAMDFYPEGFEEAVEVGMPFRGHLVADDELKDSLFYSLALADPSFLTEGFALTDSYEEALSWSVDPRNPNVIRADKISREDYNLADELAGKDGGEFAGVDVAEYASDSAYAPERECGIDPASIKVLKSEKYAKTLIATKEFQERIQLIWQTCSQEVLEVYINGLDNNLWENDQKAANLVENLDLKSTFQFLAGEKMGQLQDWDPISDQLRKHYARKLKKTRQKLQKALDQAKKELAAQNKVAEETVNAYARVLDERQNYRMFRFGFTPTETGWFDVHDPDSPFEKEWILSVTGEADIKVTVTDGDDYDRTLVYMVFPYAQSLHRMSSLDGNVFRTGTGEYADIPIPRGNEMEVIVIAWKGEESYFGENTLRPEGYQKTVDPKPLAMERIKAKIREIDWTMDESNRIAQDLEYQKKLFAEEKRQKTLFEEAIFLRELYYTINYCCTDASYGQQLFRENCSRCHSPLLYQHSTGPALLNVTERHSREWLYSWIKNSAAMIASGDPEAVKLWEDNNKISMQPMPHLTYQDIDAILAWIDLKSWEINKGQLSQ